MTWVGVALLRRRLRGVNGQRTSRMMRIIPGRRDAIFRLSFFRAETVVLYELAMEYRVSPRLTVMLHGAMDGGAGSSFGRAAGRSARRAVGCSYRRPAG